MGSRWPLLVGKSGTTQGPSNGGQTTKARPSDRQPHTVGESNMVARGKAIAIENGLADIKPRLGRRYSVGNLARERSLHHLVSSDRSERGLVVSRNQIFRSEEFAGTRVNSKFRLHCLANGGENSDSSPK